MGTPAIRGMIYYEKFGMRNLESRVFGPVFTFVFQIPWPGRLDSIFKILLLSLSLLMLRVRAHHNKPPLPADDFTVPTHFFHRRTHFHLPTCYPLPTTHNPGHQLYVVGRRLLVICDTQSSRGDHSPTPALQSRGLRERDGCGAPASFPTDVLNRVHRSQNAHEMSPPATFRGSGPLFSLHSADSSGQGKYGRVPQDTIAIILRQAQSTLSSTSKYNMRGRCPKKRLGGRAGMVPETSGERGREPSRPRPPG